MTVTSVRWHDLGGSGSSYCPLFGVIKSAFNQVLPLLPGRDTDYNLNLRYALRERRRIEAQRGCIGWNWQWKRKRQISIEKDKRRETEREKIRYR